MLKITNLTKTFKEHKVLNEINLCVESGEIIGLAGSSGSGKSTLLRCIQKLDVPDSGIIESTDTVGFMFQDFQLFPHFTVLENVIYSPKINKNNGYLEEGREILSKLNMEHRLNHYPSQLSGGQKQRVALARTMMMKPSILLCDEPTSGLDLVTIDDVVKLLKDALSISKMSMILASHDLDFLTKISSRIVILKGGKIVCEVDSVDGYDINNLKKYFSICISK